jgi:hypothetical protein
MPKTSIVTFENLRRLLEGLGYRHESVDRGEVFHLSKDRELYYRRYSANDIVFTRDLMKTRSFLDDWGQLDGVDFDAFLDSSSKPA